MYHVKDLGEFINEGRYDKISGEAVDKIWEVIKLSRAAGEKDYILGLGKLVGGDITFNLILNIKRGPVGVAQGFVLNAGAYTERGDNLIEIIIVIDPSQEPKAYQKLNSKLQDAMRHEIEHLTQGGFNKIYDRPKPTRAKTRNKINIANKNIHKYFLLRDEVPAMVQGMYRQAKTEKRKLDEIFNEYLGYFIGQDLISKKEKEKILKVWMKFAKANVPAAQYSNNNSI